MFLKEYIGEHTGDQKLQPGRMRVEPCLFFAENRCKILTPFFSVESKKIKQKSWKIYRFIAYSDNPSSLSRKA